MEDKINDVNESHQHWHEKANRGNKWRVQSEQAVSRLALCDYNLHGRFITVKHPNTQSRLPYLRQMLSKLFSQQRHLRGSYIRQSVQVSGVLPRARELGHTGNELKSRNGPAKRENREAPERLQVW